MSSLNLEPKSEILKKGKKMFCPILEGDPEFVGLSHLE